MNVHSHPAAAPTSRGETTREAILDAALALFAERGFHGTAVPAIARRAGIAAGTIYRHFAGKEELVNVLYRRCKRALLGYLAEVDDGAPTRARFAALWRALRRFAGDAPLAFEFLELHHHAAYLDDDSRRVEGEAILAILSHLGRAIEDGDVARRSPQALVSVVWGAFVGLVKSARLGYYELTDELFDEAEETCWNGIKAG